MFNHALTMLVVHLRIYVAHYISPHFVFFIFISNSCVFVSVENGIANENNHDAEPQRKLPPLAAHRSTTLILYYFIRYV